MTITDIDALADAAAALVHGSSRVILGVTGAPGSGKSTLVQALVRELSSRQPPQTQREEDGIGAEGPWVAQVPMDGFHLADESLERLGLLDVKGAPETFDAHGYAALLGRIADPAQRDVSIYAPTFQREVEQPIAGAIEVPPSASLVITEGNYLLLPDDPWPSVRRHLAQVWHCATEETRRQDQLIRRHIEHGKSPQEAREWALGPDEANAIKVTTASRGADLIIGEQLLQSAKN